MEDDNGLELTLGLSCGGSSGKSKTKDVSSDPKVDEGRSDRSMGGKMTVVDSSFKNFFQTDTENQDQKGKQKSAPDLQQQGNLWKDLGKCSTPVTDHSNDVQNNLSEFNRYQELWVSNNKTAKTDEEKSNKRKMPFEDLNFQNKPQKTVDYADTNGVNEDVAESEAEGSNSFLVSQHEEKSKSPDIPKFSDKYVISDSRGIGLHGQKESPESGGFSSPCGMQPMPNKNSERPAVQAMNSSNLQLSFGYSPVQLPTLETGSSWAFNSQPRHVTSFLSRDGAPNAQNSDGLKTSHVPVQAPLTSSAGTIHEKSLNMVRGNGNHVEEVGSSQNADQNKGTFIFYPQKEKTNQSLAEVISRDESAIRPGVASDVKFGGSGSYPELPWVTTTGPGPNGRTISGVTYKYNQNEVRIVCACHGIHMSLEKFIQHASSDIPNLENNTDQSSIPSSHPAASAKS